MKDVPQLAGAKHQPYWWDDAPRPPHVETALPKEVDVLIVGSGYTGLSAALTLARADRSVLICEAKEAGHGASSRNGGGCGTMPYKLSYAATETIFGERRALDLWREGSASVDYVEELVKAEQIACNFTRSGRFTGAHRPGEYEKEARRLEMLRRKLGHEGDMVPKAEQHRELGTDYYHGGRIVHRDASLHPGLYHQGLLDRVKSAGAIVADRTEVLGAERNGAGFTVRTRRGNVTARDVIVGTNGYTGGAFPFLERRVIPVKSQMIATEPLAPELMQRLMPKGRLINDTKRTRNYYRPSPDGTRILMGGRPTLRDAPIEVSARHLRDFLVQVFPELAETRITHAWDGNLGFTFDQLPHIGTHDGIHYACGYLGSGVAMSTYLGHKLGLRVLGSPDAHTVLDDRLFPTMPFYKGNPWFLSTVAAYYRFRDKFG